MLHVYQILQFFGKKLDLLLQVHQIRQTDKISHDNLNKSVITNLHSLIALKIL